jgi:zinc transporter ZupT
MDNFCINIISEGQDHLTAALKLGFRDYKATFYAVSPDAKRLTYFWSDPSGHICHSLPFKFTHADAASFTHRWLQESASYSNEPDIDGSCGKGWRVFTDSLGHVDGIWQSIVAIEPVWAMYGK